MQEDSCNLCTTSIVGLGKSTNEHVCIHISFFLISLCICSTMHCVYIELYNAQLLDDLLHGYHHIVIWSLLKYCTQTKCVFECMGRERERQSEWESKWYASLPYSWRKNPFKCWQLYTSLNKKYSFEVTRNVFACVVYNVGWRAIFRWWRTWIDK